MNIADTKRRFFVRVKAEKKEEAAAVFSSIEEVDAGLTEEFAFITAVMTEKEFDEKIASIGGSINRIRLEN